jgi:iduronate 2-sulfatase
LTEHDELNAYLRAYYASTSFADAQLGRLMDAIEARGLRESTYLVVTSDHGYMLGEKRQFGKFELREVALQVPLFIAGPDVPARVAPDPVSLLDLYPTLCGLAGLPVPLHCQGQDLSATLRSGAQAPRGYAISYYGGRVRKGGESGVMQLHSSVRTPEWRLINYGPATSWLRRAAEFGAEETELYDHDPSSPGYDPYEWYNLSEKLPDVVADLRALQPAPTTFNIVVTGEAESE